MSATEKLQTTATCRWNLESADYSVWHTSCGNDFYIENDETPSANGMKYCCYCGKSLEDNKPEEEFDDEAA